MTRCNSCKENFNDVRVYVGPDKCTYLCHGCVDDIVVKYLKEQENKENAAAHEKIRELYEKLEKLTHATLSLGSQNEALKRELETNRFVLKQITDAADNIRLKNKEALAIISRLDGLLAAAGKRDTYMPWKDDIKFQALDLLRDVLKPDPEKGGEQE